MTVKLTTMGEQRTQVGGVEVCWEGFGDDRDPHVLLIMGLGLDLLWWREDFCRDLAARGHYVIRFDNRDTGRSTHFRSQYALGDMADDAAGLIGPDGACVVGVSLGACIAQEVAIRHPHRTRALVSIMGRPGDGRNGRVPWRGRLEFLRPAGDPVTTFRRIGSTFRAEADDEDVRLLTVASAQREAGDGTGARRQLKAMRSERDRTADLRRLDLPALVVHGRRDHVIHPSGGRATAAAKLLEIDDMGHDLARAMWPRLVDAISAVAARGSAPGR